jgi:hypothetical protein
MRNVLDETTCLAFSHFWSIKHPPVPGRVKKLVTRSKAARTLRLILGTGICLGLYGMMSTTVANAQFRANNLEIGREGKLALPQTIEGHWNESKNLCGVAGSNEVEVTRTKIDGLEWGCSIIKGTFTPARWSLQARCSGEGGYETPYYSHHPIPSSKVVITLGNKGLTIAGDKPLYNYGEAKTAKRWSMTFPNRCDISH